MSESASSLVHRIFIATGLRPEQIPDAPGEAMLGGSIVARRGNSVVVLTEYCGQDDTGADNYGRAVIVGRSADLPPALPGATGVMWASTAVVDSRAYQVRARVFLAVPQAGWGRSPSWWDGLHPRDIGADIHRRLAGFEQLAVVTSNPAILRAVQSAVRDGLVPAEEVVILDIAVSGEETTIPLTTTGAFARAWPAGPPR